MRYNAKIGDTVIGGVEVTLQDVSDGENGISPTVTVNHDTSLTIVDAKGTSKTPVLKGDKGDQGAQGIQGLQGPTGTQGVAGPKGADGKTQYTHIAYANSSDGKTDFSTSDSNRAYIGMYVNFNIDDSTTPSDYSWTLVKGADGTQGTPGKAGADGKTPYFHTAWSYSADGTDGFTTVYPNLNLLDGTKDFSGDWYNSTTWYKSGTYKGLTVMAYNAVYNAGLAKPFNIPSDGIYSMSMLVKVKTGSIGQFVIESTGKPAIIMDITDTGGKFVTQSYTGTFTTGQTVLMYFRFNNDKNVIKDGLSVAGYKIEPGSVATPWMSSASEVTTADWPSYIGQYTDFTQADSTNPSSTLSLN